MWPGVDLPAAKSKAPMGLQGILLNYTQLSLNSAESIFFKNASIFSQRIQPVKVSSERLYYKKNSSILPGHLSPQLSPEAVS